MKSQQHFYCFRLPQIREHSLLHYRDHAGEFIITTAVSPKQAASHAITKRFRQYGNVFRKVQGYLHESFKQTDSTPGLTAFVFDIDEADRPVRQGDLFTKSTPSHRRLNEIDIANKISERYKIPNEGEDSIPRKISRDYIQYRRKHPLTK